MFTGIYRLSIHQFNIVWGEGVGKGARRGWGYGGNDMALKSADIPLVLRQHRVFLFVHAFGVHAKSFLSTVFACCILFVHDTYVVANAYFLLSTGFEVVRS